MQVAFTTNLVISLRNHRVRGFTFCLCRGPNQHTSCSFYLNPIAALSVDISRLAAGLALAGLLSFVNPSHTKAVSGGGRDYASKDYSGVDFSEGTYDGKDFSGGKFRGADFRNAKLTRARFFKADLREADMSGADLSFATLEGGYLKGLDLGNAILRSSYTSDSIVDVGNLQGADFSDCLVPTFLLPKLCDREDAKGVNPVTHVGTRESLLCPE